TFTILYYVPITISNPGGPTPSSVPSGIISYVPITITNSQPSNTPTPFQQMVNITESQFSSYNIIYSNTIANFEFFTQSGTVIPAWIESNNTGKLITWVNLPTAIPASSSVIIYIGFAPKTTNLLSSSGTTGIGEAPQLPCGTTATSACATYAEYDDGAKVFNFYDNFAGTSLNTSKWTVSNEQTYTINNGITLNPSATSGLALSSVSTFSSQGTIAEIYGSFNAPNQKSIYNGQGFYIGGSSSGTYVPLGGYVYTGANLYGLYDFSASGLLAQFNPEPTASTNYIYTWWETSSGTYAEYNYANLISTSTIETAGTYSLDLFNSQNMVGNMYVQYARVRAYPPNGVMPTVTFDFPQATGTNFQQMINITESSFSSYLTYNSNFANFEYFYANGNIIPAWIESNNSGKLITWAKLSKSIPASSNVIIYLGFAGANNLLSSSGTSGIGEAPQLTCPIPSNTLTCDTTQPYAEYDDGASVFTNYWNFAGTSLPSNLSKIGGGDDTVSVSNDLNISNPATNTNTQLGWGWVYSNSILTVPYILEQYTISATGAYRFGLTSSFSIGLQEMFYDSYVSQAGPAGTGVSGVMTSSTTIAGIPITPSLNSLSLAVYSFSWAGTGSQYYAVNYTSATSVDTTILFSSPLYAFTGATYYAVGGAAATSETIQWLRTRAYPPNGVMPTVTFGSVS
ncbi:hypothetical protein M1141_01390, partial [Candidatus Marsarchaeota archaeon]|nr:hypothetical protein [Candidatus Marsarchaeota archaeon]